MLKIEENENQKYEPNKLNNYGENYDMLSNFKENEFAECLME